MVCFTLEPTLRAIRFKRLNHRKWKAIYSFTYRQETDIYLSDNSYKNDNKSILEIACSYFYSYFGRAFFFFFFFFLNGTYTQLQSSQSVHVLKSSDLQTL